MKAFALTGRILYIFLIPRVLPWEGTEKVPIFKD